MLYLVISTIELARIVTTNLILPGTKSRLKLNISSHRLSAFEDSLMPSIRKNVGLDWVPDKVE